MGSPDAIPGPVHSSESSKREIFNNFRSTENRPPVIPTAIDEDQKALWRLDDDGGNQWIRYPSPDEV